MKRPFQFIFFSLSISLMAGCNLRGIHYEFIPLHQYEAGEVLNQPEEKFTVPQVEKINKPAIQFFALGCAGSGNEGQRIVASSMDKIASEMDIDFTLYLGDNFYGRGVSSVEDDQWQSKFEDIYHQESLRMPFYAVLGNHDHYKNPAAQIAYSEHSDRWRMPDEYYSFEKELEDGTRIQFFALDTVLILAEEPEQMKWLEEELRKSTADWKIVYGHHPIYSGSETWVDEIQVMKENVEPLLTKYGVNLYLSAHNHSIEIFEEISGVTYVVSGAGSRPRDVYWVEQTNFAHADLGFAWLQVMPQQMNIYIVGREGQVLYKSEIPASQK